MDKHYNEALLNAVLSQDLDAILEKDREYNASWLRRGGAGAFMMLARKWDRLEPFVAKHGYDIFRAIETDPRAEGVIDDIRDLRRYLALVEAEMRGRGAQATLQATPGTTPADPPEQQDGVVYETRDGAQVLPFRNPAFAHISPALPQTHRREAYTHGYDPAEDVA